MPRWRHFLPDLQTKTFSVSCLVTVAMRALFLLIAVIAGEIGFDVVRHKMMVSVLIIVIDKYNIKIKSGGY
jgi:membrane protein YdbS with pleckstrin-like domain